MIRDGYEKHYHGDVLDLIKWMIAEKPEDRPDFRQVYSAIDKIWDNDEKCGVNSFAEDEIFKGLGTYESWPLFHDLMLKRNNKNLKSKKKYDEDLFYTSLDYIDAK